LTSVIFDHVYQLLGKKAKKACEKLLYTGIKTFGLGLI